MISVLHYNTVHPVRCRHRSLDTARQEVADQLRRFRGYGSNVRILERGNKWIIGGEVVRIVSDSHCLKSWPGNIDIMAAMALTIANSAKR